MRIRLVAFASAADALGISEAEITLPEGADVDALRLVLEGAHPAIVPLWGRLAIAVDGELAQPRTPLAEGVEVALLPPVSGGSGRPGPRVALVEAPLDVAAITAAVAAPERGAILLFLGTVRNHHRRRPVTHLTYDAYRPMAKKRLAAIARELEAEVPGLAVAIEHRLGEVAAGEPSVAIAVGAPHREAAYAASRTALERLKTEVPIWKREHYEGGTAAWREEEPLRGGGVPTPAARSGSGR